MISNVKVPELSENFCERVVAASRNVAQRPSWNIRAIWSRAQTVMFPIRMNWVVASMAVLFVVGVFAGMEMNWTGATDIMEIMEI